MSTLSSGASIDGQVAQWRAYLTRRQAIHAVDIDELEDHLREQVSTLRDSGLDEDEAFLVAVKRMGAMDALSREFAHEHSERLWKQLVSDGRGDPERHAAERRDALTAFGLAGAAAVAIKAPSLVNPALWDERSFYPKNLSLFVLPMLAAYFVLKRSLSWRIAAVIAAPFIAGAALVNAYPLVPYAQTTALAAVHLPIVLWLAVGIAYAGRRWSHTGGRMDFIRFSGEFAIYYVLIALGGAVLCAFMFQIFRAAGVNINWAFEHWILPCGAMGAAPVAAWLVESKQSVIENMAPVLARLFTPLFTVGLLVFLATLLLTGRGVDIERGELIAFDLLLVAVLGLQLYTISARDPGAPRGVFDIAQAALLASALIADLVALWAISARIGEFGWTANRASAVGMNVVLLGNLVWSTQLYVRFLLGRTEFARIERWQTDYLPVYGAWAAIVVAVFPPAFGFR